MSGWRSPGSPTKCLPWTTSSASNVDLMQSNVRAASADGHGRIQLGRLGRPGDRTAASLEIVSVVPRLQKLLARPQSPLIEGFALCGSDVEVDRTNLVGGYEDGASYGARIVDVSVVLIAN